MLLKEDACAVKIMTIAIAMLKLMFPMALGFLLFKLGILNTDADARMSKLLIYVASPCLTFNSVVGMERTGEEAIWFVLIFGVVFYIIITLLAFLCAFLMRAPKKSFNTYTCLLIFGNVGFMGLPLAESLFGSTGLFYMGLLNIHFTLFAYSFGRILMARGTGTKNQIKPGDILNAATITTVITLIVFLTGVSLPDVIMEPIEFVGQITSPLAMIILGATMATYSLKKMFTQWRYYVTGLIRLIAFPLLVFLVLRAIWGVNEVTIIMTLYAGMPSATVVNMLALAYGGDTENASSCTGLMNIMSLITIPIMWMLVNNL